MATGLPAVATNSGSITEVIEDGREGVLVSGSDPIALADAIEGLTGGHDWAEQPPTRPAVATSTILRNRFP